MLARLSSAAKMSPMYLPTLAASANRPIQYPKTTPVNNEATAIATIQKVTATSAA